MSMNGASMRPFVSYTRTQDGASLITDVEAIRYLFPDANNGAVLCGDEIGLAADSEAESATDDEDEGCGEDDAGETTDVDVEHEEGMGNDSAIVDDDRHRRDYDVEGEDEGEAGTPRAILGSTPWPGSPHFDDVKTPPQPSYLARRKQEWGHQRSYSAPTAAGNATVEFPNAGIEHGARPGMRARTSNPNAATGRWSVNGGGSVNSSRGSKRSSDRGKKRKGRKLCLQLDLSSVEGEEDGAYHLGKWLSLWTHGPQLLAQIDERGLVREVNGNATEPCTDDCRQVWSSHAILDRSAETQYPYALLVDLSHREYPC